MNAIETRSLRKYYGRARGIEDISLSVAEGDIFGFIGPNGAGKSTTIRRLLGLISADSGEEGRKPPNGCLPTPSDEAASRLKSSLRLC